MSVFLSSEKVSLRREAVEWIEEAIDRAVKEL